LPVRRKPKQDQHFQSNTMPDNKPPRDKEIKSHAEPAAEETPPEAQPFQPLASTPTPSDETPPSAASQGELLEPAGGGTPPGETARQSSKGTAKPAHDDLDEEETAGTPRLESDKFAAPKNRPGSK
jgi:hypothetical protein